MSRLARGFAGFAGVAGWTCGGWMVGAVVADVAVVVVVVVDDEFGAGSVAVAVAGAGSIADVGVAVDCANDAVAVVIRATDCAISDSTARSWSSQRVPSQRSTTVKPLRGSESMTAATYASNTSASTFVQCLAVKPVLLA